LTGSAGSSARGNGYFQIQSTRPQTLAYGLTDSPAGQLESMHAAAWGKEASPTPTGVAVFAEDVAIRRFAEGGNNIVHWSDFDRGGHFAAMEAPDLLVGDVRAFFRRFR
jgi:epoxide hydrolase